MYGSPGKKLLFMGVEFAQEREWNHDRPLDWHLADIPEHAGVGRWLTDLNRLYAGESAMHRHDFDPEGFQWVDANDADQSVLSMLRLDGERVVLAAFNFTPVPRMGYRIGVPASAHWHELLNSDAGIYGGGDLGNLGGVPVEPVPWHGREQSIRLTLPPLAAVFLRAE
jgi:1,4-alpha-glucan branching enzyme